jgi:hypothetical protein
MSDKTTAVAPKAKGESVLEKLLAVAITPAEREQSYRLAEKVQQQRAVAEMAAAIAETSWGQKVSPLLRAQITRYAFEIGADPARHLDVLGGRPYLNAAFYMELVAVDPGYLRSETQFIHDDDRATPEDREERKGQRVTFGVPEGVKGAAIVTLYFKDGRGPHKGCKWSPSNKNDPVGTEFPVLTAETRAWRKAATKAVSPWFSTHPMLAKIEALVEGQELGEGKTTLPPGGPGRVALAEPEPIALAPIAHPQPIRDADPTKQIKHQPSAICSSDGEHDVTTCGYTTRQAVA